MKVTVTGLGHLGLVAAAGLAHSGHEVLATDVDREDAYSRMEQSETKMALEERIDDIRRLSAQGAAAVVMSITKDTANNR